MKAHESRSEGGWDPLLGNQIGGQRTSGPPRCPECGDIMASMTQGRLDYCPWWERVQRCTREALDAMERFGEVAWPCDCGAHGPIFADAPLLAYRRPVAHRPPLDAAE